MTTSSSSAIGACPRAMYPKSGHMNPPRAYTSSRLSEPPRAKPCRWPDSGLIDPPRAHAAWGTAIVARASGARVMTKIAGSAANGRRGTAGRECSMRMDAHPPSRRTEVKYKGAGDRVSDWYSRAIKGGRKGRKESKKWGDRPVQLLLAIRLGLDCVNPIYYETIKSVGMAGGRPSSSNYFMDDSLFYLDPHHSRPAVPLRPFAAEPAIFVITRAPLARATIAVPQAACARGGSMSPESGHRHGFARGGSLSLELVYARGADGGGRARCHAALYLGLSLALRQACRSPPAGEAISPMEETYFAQAHSAAEMRIFHCEQFIFPKSFSCEVNNPTLELETWEEEDFYVTNLARLLPRHETDGKAVDFERESVAGLSPWASSEGIPYE
ncbi:hypothetical protein B0H19DRAFT_1328033 [Mycena capillaripes]|nr:hypothetical protein B0H19DRAFT_1328033 [Mycena capillaripes]